MTITSAAVSRSSLAASSKFDPLSEFNRPASPAVDPRQTFRTFGGFALAGVGTGVSLWIIYLLHAALFRPEKLGFLFRLVSQDRADLVLALPAGRIELPPAALPIIAYVLLIALVALGAKVATALIKEGALLLRHDPPPHTPVAAPLSRPPGSTSPPTQG